MNDDFISYEEFQQVQEMNNFNNSCGMNQSITKEEMLLKIKQLKFSIIELGLYLDTHPNDNRALMIYRDYANKLKNLKEMYQKMYGPLSIFFPCNTWRWIDEPWPWEGSEE